MNSATRVTAIMVTYNRRDLLAEALTAVLAQTRPPDHVVVVDNASADGTAAMVRDRFGDRVELLPMTHNTGGAGGFAAGIEHALRGPADRLWLMDDDTVPTAGALAALLKVADGTALVAGRVVWTDGRDHPMNTPRPKHRPTAVERVAAAALDCVPIRSASFVSVLVDAAAVRESGPPIADYFLWNDDFEFTTRLLRGRRGLLCPAGVAVHKTAVFGGADADPGERFFYEVRNKIWLFTRSRGLAPVERLLYAGSTVRRWLRTFAASDDRCTLWRGLRNGVRAGLRDRPRPNAEVLASVTGSDAGPPAGSRAEPGARPGTEP